MKKTYRSAPISPTRKSSPANPADSRFRVACYLLLSLAIAQNGFANRGLGNYGMA